MMQFAFGEARSEFKSQISTAESFHSVFDFLRTYGAMFRGRQVTGIHQSHRVQIVAGADRRRSILFQSAQQFGHRSDKRIGKPDAVPTRRMPCPVVMYGRIVNRAGNSSGIAWPANRASRKTGCPFDTPADADVSGTAFACRTAPDVIPRRRSDAILELQNIQRNSVAMREFARRTGIRGDTGKDSFRIAQPVTKRVQMMDAHNSQGDPSLTFLPGHPVRNRSHVDRG